MMEKKTKRFIFLASHLVIITFSITFIMLFFMHKLSLTNVIMIAMISVFTGIGVHGAAVITNWLGS